MRRHPDGPGEKPHPAPDLPTGRVTFLLTDIEGSSALFRRIGERYETILAAHHRIIRRAIAAYGGTEFKTEGDAFIVAFSEPADAVAATVAMQTALGAYRGPEGEQLRVRMGMHCGDAKVVDGDYVSFGLHQAARVIGAAHGGQVLLSSVVAGAVGDALPEHVALQDLGGYILRDFDDPEHLFQVRHPDLLGEFPPPRAPLAAVRNLVPPRTSFVGRSDELDELAKVVDVARLVTVVGPGGIGKTRISSEVGWSRAGHFVNGVWLVALAGLTDESRLAPTVAAALGVAEQPGRTVVEVVAERCAAGRALLILDNCEHLIDGCAQLADQLLEWCSDLSILATSREPLQISGEHVYRLAPLGLPEPGMPLEELARCESVALFCQRAAQARRAFSLDDDPDAVAAICRRLDGIPLAIELAAARLGSLPATQLAAHLEDTLGMLDGGVRRGGDDRQRTLRGAIAWSDRLLDDEERRVLRHLSVFRGGFTHEAAERVAAPGVVRSPGGWGVLEQLVVQSLVEPSEDTEPPRYRLLEPVRQYAEELLEAAGESEAARRAHLEWCEAMATESATRYNCPDEHEWLARLEADIDNLRAGLAAAVELREGDDVATLARMLFHFWERTGRWTEGVAQADVLLGCELSAAARGGVVMARSSLVQNQGDYAAARSGFEEAMRLLAGDQALVTNCVAAIAAVAECQGDYATAELCHDDALRRFRAAGDRRGVARCVFGLSELAGRRGDLDTARRGHEEALAEFNALGDVHGEAGCHYRLAELAGMAGDYPRAQEHYDQSLMLARELGDRQGAAACLGGLAQLAANRSDLAAARVGYEEALAAFRDVGDRPAAAHCLCGLAELSRLRGEVAAAQAGYEQALADLRSFGDASGVAACLHGLGDAAAFGGDYAEAAARFNEALAELAELGDRRGAAWCLFGLAEVARLQQSPVDAHTRFGDALRELREVGDRRGVAGCLLGLAEAARLAVGTAAEAPAGSSAAEARRGYRDAAAAFVALEDRAGLAAVARGLGLLECGPGDRTKGVELLAAATAAVDDLGVPWPAPDRLAVDAATAGARAELGPRFDASWERGRTADLAALVGGPPPAT